MVMSAKLHKPASQTRTRTLNDCEVERSENEPVELKQRPRDAFIESGLATVDFRQKGRIPNASPLYQKNASILCLVRTGREMGTLVVVC